MLRYKRPLPILGAILLLGIAGYIALIIRDDQKARSAMAGDLKIKGLPSSIHNLNCYMEPVWTDTLWHCYFEIEPKDFSALLTGREYQVTTLKTTSHDVLEKISEHGDLGPNFGIAKRYYVQPSDFKNGGAITIYTDAAQRHVLYDVYIE